MSQDRTYAASIEQDGDRRVKRFCKTTSWCIVRTFNIVRTMRPVWATLNKTLIHNTNGKHSN